MIKALANQAIPSFLHSYINFIWYEALSYFMPNWAKGICLQVSTYMYNKCMHFWKCLPFRKILIVILWQINLFTCFSWRVRRFRVPRSLSFIWTIIQIRSLWICNLLNGLGKSSWGEGYQLCSSTQNWW